MTRFNRLPTEISWFGGVGGVTAVRGDSHRVTVDLSYRAEGSAAPEPESVTTMIELDFSGRLSIDLGGGREGLLQCGKAIERIKGDSPTSREDQTVAIQFPLA